MRRSLLDSCEVMLWCVACSLYVISSVNLLLLLHTCTVSCIFSRDIRRTPRAFFSRRACTLCTIMEPPEETCARTCRRNNMHNRTCSKRSQVCIRCCGVTTLLVLWRFNDRAVVELHLLHLPLQCTVQCARFLPWNTLGTATVHSD